MKTKNENVNENNISTSSTTHEIVLFNPTELITLKRLEKGGAAKGSLEIKNINQNKSNIIFKIKTTAPDLFVVNPTTGIVS
jgi:hypothetical protein